MADGNTENQDALHSGGQPSGPNGTDISQPQAYTQDPVDKLHNERHSKLDRQISDLTKERDSLKPSNDALSQRLPFQGRIARGAGGTGNDMTCPAKDTGPAVRMRSCDQ
jgi:hypothetical protein